MSKIEEKALKAYPGRSILIQPARRGGYYADNHLREGYIEGYRQALEDVRGELERQYVYWDNVMISSASPNAVASKNRIKEILDFIDEQNK